MTNVDGDDDEDDNDLDQDANHPGKTLRPVSLGAKHRHTQQLTG